MKTTRKKMLLSSIAMLLVALVALGSATYAWFSLNKTVTASGMQVQASAPKGLQITGKNGSPTAAVTDSNWGPSVAFGDTANSVTAISVAAKTDEAIPSGYYPASVKDASTSAKAILNSTASNKDDFGAFTGVTAASDGNVPTAAGTLAKIKGTYYAKYEVGIRATDSETAGKAITLTATLTGSTADAKYIRAAIIEGQAENLATAKVVKVVSPDSVARSVNAVNAATPAVTSVSADASGSTLSITKIGNTTSAKWYTIVMWVEGQDANCYDAYPSLSGSLDLQFQAAD